MFLPQRSAGDDVPDDRRTTAAEGKQESWKCMMFSYRKSSIIQIKLLSSWDTFVYRQHDSGFQKAAVRLLSLVHFGRIVTEEIMNGMQSDTSASESCRRFTLLYTDKHSVYFSSPSSLSVIISVHPPPSLSSVSLSISAPFFSPPPSPPLWTSHT